LHHCRLPAVLTFLTDGLQLAHNYKPGIANSRAHISRVVPAWHALKASGTFPSPAFTRAAIMHAVELAEIVASSIHCLTVAKHSSCRWPWSHKQRHTLTYMLDYTTALHVRFPCLIPLTCGQTCTERTAWLLAETEQRCLGFRWEPAAHHASWWSSQVNGSPWGLRRWLDRTSALPRAMYARYTMTSRVVLSTSDSPARSWASFIARW